MEVEITFERKELEKRFQTATATFSTVPDLDLALPTQPDIGQHRKPEMSATKSEVQTGSGNNIEWKELEMRYQRLPPHGIADMARHRPTLETRNVGNGTGSGNRKWK